MKMDAKIEMLQRSGLGMVSQGTGKSSLEERKAAVKSKQLQDISEDEDDEEDEIEVSSRFVECSSRAQAFSFTGD